MDQNSRSGVRASAVLLVVLLVTFASKADAQSPLEFLRNESAKSDFQNVLRQAGVSLNFDGAMSNNVVAVVPVRQRWSETLGRKGSAVVGAIYSREQLRNLSLGPGLYTVEARRDERLGLLYWILRSSDGRVMSRPVQICVERLSEEVSVPRALLISRSPDRCCFEDDSIRQCGECD